MASWRLIVDIFALLASTLCFQLESETGRGATWQQVLQIYGRCRRMGGSCSSLRPDSFYFSINLLRRVCSSFRLPTGTFDKLWINAGIMAAVVGWLIFSVLLG